MELFYQCHFEQETPDGKQVLVAWIEKRGAKVGSLVELRGEDGLWLVTSTGGDGHDEKWLQEKRQFDRRSLQSIVH